MDTNLEFLLEELRTRSGVIWGDFSGNPNENPTPVTENAPNDITWLVETSTATPSIWLKGGGSWIVIGTDLSSSIAAVQQALADTVVAKDATELAKAAAETARDVSAAAGKVYVDTAAGIAATTTGQYFWVPSASDAEVLMLYRNVSGVATDTGKRNPSAAQVWAIEARKRTAVIGKNRFNPADINVAVGYAINSATGALASTAGFRATGYIPVTAGLTYTMSIGRAYAWYNASRAYLSGGAGTGTVQTVTAPTGAAYFRTGVSDGTLTAFQFEIGSSVTAYQAYTEEPGLNDGAVASRNILRGAVTPYLTSFISAGKNKFDKDSVTVGKYITASGVLGDNVSYDASDYIKVTPGVAYKVSAGIRFSCYFDAALNVVAGGITVETTTFTAPVGAAFVRISIGHASLASFQLEIGTTTSAYESFRLVNDFAAPAIDGSVDSDALADASVTPVKTTFFNPSKNLFNKNTVTAGFYLSNGGALGANASYEVSDYIAITPGETYSLSPALGVRFSCYFDANLAVVAGGTSVGSISQFTAPAGAVWIRITIFVTSHDAFQVELGGVSTSYASFGFRLKPEMIPESTTETTSALVMPPYIYGVEGRECNVYLDNLHIDDADGYLHAVNSSSGTGYQQAERWTWTPSAALSSGSLSVSAHHKKTGDALVFASANQRAAASTAGTGMMKKVMVIGDSLINAAVITQTLLDIAATDVMGVTLLGTRGTGSNKHEGRGGWTIASYTTNYSDVPSGANPFWIGGVVNFPQYLTNNSIATPDWVAIHLGINDVFGQDTDTGALSAAATAFTSLDTLIASIKAAGAGVNVVLMLPTPAASSQDAFGASYGTGQTRWRFKRNIMLWTQALIARYAGQEANRIYIAPTNTALDTVNNVSYGASAAVNSRSAVMVARQSNGVHPASSGYQQIGDALWAFLKYYA